MFSIGNSRERGNAKLRLLLYATGGKAPDAPIGHQHTKGNIMVKHREFRNDLLIKPKPARDADKLGLGEEAVVEAHASADAVALFAEAQPRYDDHVDKIDGYRFAADRFTDARAAGGHVVIEAVDFDGKHSALVPAYFGNDDGFTLLPGFEGERGGIDFGRHAQIEHDDASSGELGRSGNKITRDNTLMVPGVFRHSRQRFSKLSAKCRFICDFRHRYIFSPLNIFHGVYRPLRSTILPDHGLPAYPVQHYRQNSPTFVCFCDRNK